MAFSTPAEVCMERTINIHEKTGHIGNHNIEELYDIKRTVDWVQTNNYKRVCLQLPDSLLGDSVEVCKKLKSLLNNEDVFILADTTYNSCCVDEVAANHIEADSIIHYGHSCLSPTNFPVLYVYPKVSIDIDAAVNAMRGVDSLDVVLFYDVSLEHLREPLCQKFFQAFPHLQIGVLPKENGNKSLVFGRSIIDKDGGEMDSIAFNQTHLVFIGTEGPTLFNLAVCSKAKELHLLDSSTCVLSAYSQSQWFKRRRFLVEKCKDVTTIGVLVCTLSVSNYLHMIQRAKSLVRARGKKVYTLTVGKPNVAKLANLSEIQLFVLVACPENELYSSKDFLSPIIYPYELELALNQHRDQFDTNYSTDFNELLPEGRNHRPVEQNGDHPPDVSLISGNIRDINIDIDNTFDKKNLKDMQLDALRKEDWAVSELGIGKAINDRSWKGLEQDLGNTSVELAAVGRKGIASGYEGELF